LFRSLANSHGGSALPRNTAVPSLVAL
jgi:hypothetical protein